MQPIDDVRLVGTEPTRIAVNRKVDHPMPLLLGDQHLLAGLAEPFASELPEGLEEAIAPGIGLEDDHRLIHEIGQQTGDVRGLDWRAAGNPLGGLEGEPARED